MVPLITHTATCVKIRFKPDQTGFYGNFRKMWYEITEVLLTIVLQIQFKLDQTGFYGNFREMWYEITEVLLTIGGILHHLTSQLAVYYII